MPDTLALAAQERLAEAPHTVVGLLEVDPNNPLARSLARLGRALLARVTLDDLQKCQSGNETALDRKHEDGARLVGAQVTQELLGETARR